MFLVKKCCHTLGYTLLRCALQNNLVGTFPTRTEYEERQKKAEEMRKYSEELSVQEILEMYDDDPESYFMDKTRKASEVYKLHCMEQLKKEFSKISVKVIKEIFSQNNCLFLPSVRDLEKHMQNTHQEKIHECDFCDKNFLSYCTL